MRLIIGTGIQRTMANKAEDDFNKHANYVITPSQAGKRTHSGLGAPINWSGRTMGSQECVIYMQII